MRYTKMLLPTLKEAPAEAQVVSHILLVRAGYIRKLAAGVYSLLPLGMRVVKKIERIIREELDRAGAEEVLLPMFHPAELWQESGRWQKYEPELLRVKDRKGAEFAVSPTAEEAIVDLVRRDVKSYRQLPLNLYQIQDKFRDEMRPRAGLMRGREFIMKDGYSFHASAEDAQREYQNMYDAYQRIFKRCGLAFRAVEADTGAIGGSMSHEFQVLADSGEDAIVSCDTCEYAANIEKADLSPVEPRKVTDAARVEKVATPGKESIEDVAAFMNVKPEETVKTMVFSDGRAFAMVSLRGDRQVNEAKLRARLGWADLLAATPEQFTIPEGSHQFSISPEGLIGPAFGYVGPIDHGSLAWIPKENRFIDAEVIALDGPFVAGANERGHHNKNVVISRDVHPVNSLDVRVAQAGDLCGRCKKGHYRAHRGIEVGHVFFLGTKYSEPMKCNFLDADGKDKPMIMGCYGIGVTRIAAAAVEQNHDDNGICWPMALSPFQVLIVTAGKEAELATAAENLEKDLTARGIEVLYDDRDERGGVKFKDADLMGIPIRVTVGKRGLAEQKLELKGRRDKEARFVPIGEIADELAKEVANELEKLVRA